VYICYNESEWKPVRRNQISLKSKIIVGILALVALFFILFYHQNSVAQPAIVITTISDSPNIVGRISVATLE
jgi:hypothetical protein